MPKKSQPAKLRFHGDAVDLQLVVHGEQGFQPRPARRSVRRLREHPCCLAGPACQVSSVGQRHEDFDSDFVVLDIDEGLGGVELRPVFAGADRSRSRRCPAPGACDQSKATLFGLLALRDRDQRARLSPPRGRPSSARPPAWRPSPVLKCCRKPSLAGGLASGYSR